MPSLKNNKISKLKVFLLICLLVTLGIDIYLLYRIFFKNTKTVVENGVEKKKSELVPLIFLFLIMIPTTYYAFGLYISVDWYVLF